MESLQPRGTPPPPPPPTQTSSTEETSTTSTEEDLYSMLKTLIANTSASYSNASIISSSTAATLFSMVSG